MPTKHAGQTLLNPQGRKAWRENGPTGGQDLWEMHGVWEWDSTKNSAAVPCEDYFVNYPATGRKVALFFPVSGGWLGRMALTMVQIDWYTDFYYPFLKKWTERVRRAVANERGHEKLFFVEPVPNEVKRGCLHLPFTAYPRSNQLCPPSWTQKHQPPNMVFAPHWSVPFLLPSLYFPKLMGVHIRYDLRSPIGTPGPRVYHRCRWGARFYCTMTNHDPYRPVPTATPVYGSIHRLTYRHPVVSTHSRTPTIQLSALPLPVLPALATAAA